MRPLCDRLSRCLLLLTLALPLHALADDPLAGLDQGMVGPRAQVLVLATAHLRYLPADFDAKALDGLMRRLAGFKPDVITVELQPPAECDLVKRWPEKYGEGYNCPRTEALKHAPDLLPMYRQLNRPDVLRRLAQANVAPAMRYPSPQRYPQWWVAGWEIRNLRMVANIRETFRERPGARVLSIVGASHKPWFDHWLGQLQGVSIVDAEQVLD